MKLYTLSIDSETVVANTDNKEFEKSVIAILENDLLGSIESLLGHGQNINILVLQLIELKKGYCDLLDLAHDLDYHFQIKEI
ncbi:hypothetical protein QOK74_08360 [Staphylococcus saprophyticus]|uniref:hypothetical protein n=1 Tax=Staphylococcus saprophyticus TaxID=29385 RepID=UPI0024C323FE|nr:hypothetical protein [Staphylococcus saprophyticus]MDK1672884.1 hypothetical protein [Staphylococcus saprophyticus]